MSKAIIVIDMPEACIDCPLHFDDDPDFWCGYSGKDLRTDDIETYKPDWCPLKPVPEKKVVKQYQGNGVYGFKTAEEAHFSMGWNDCIDEILKGGAV